MIRPKMVYCQAKFAGYDSEFSKFDKVLGCSENIWILQKILENCYLKNGQIISCNNNKYIFPIYLLATSTRKVKCERNKRNSARKAGEKSKKKDIFSYEAQGIKIDKNKIESLKKLIKINNRLRSIMKWNAYLFQIERWSLDSDTNWTCFTFIKYSKMRILESRHIWVLWLLTSRLTFQINHYCIYWERNEIIQIPKCDWINCNVDYFFFVIIM